MLSIYGTMARIVQGYVSSAVAFTSTVQRISLFLQIYKRVDGYFRALVPR